MLYGQLITNLKSATTALARTCGRFICLASVLALPGTVLAVPGSAPASITVTSDRGPAGSLESITVISTLKAGVTAAQIQKALDVLTNGGEVLLPPGKIIVTQPIVMDHNGETLRGAGQTTMLYLADNANCPVIIMGEPVNHPMQTIRHLHVLDLFIDGNRTHQQRELWREKGEGSEIRNNGITVQNVSDSSIENVTCAHCRSGGLVTTLGVRRLTVSKFDSFDNEFDGLACYLTMDSVFTKLYLHDNPCAGISLDLAFDHNVIKDATLTSNDLGIFMRDSRNNQFYNVSIRNNRDFGVFMAQAYEPVEHGARPQPDTECTGNSFTNLVALKNGRAAFRVNDASCTNNVIIAPQFGGGILAALSVAQPHLVMVK